MANRSETKKSFWRFLPALAAIVFAAAAIFGATAWSAKNRSGNVPISEVAAASQQLAAPVFKPIEEVQVGDRVALATNPGEPFDDSLGLEVVPASWRKVKFLRNDGAQAVLLRPSSWIRDWRASDARELQLSESGLSGNYEIVSIEPCPPLAEGEGQVVTGTFSHYAPATMRIDFASGATQVTCTLQHPFWSPDAQRFVEAENLVVGDRLLGRDDSLHEISSIAFIDEPSQVFNLEIHGEHVFQVTTAGVLVHNAKEYIPYPDWMRHQYNNGAPHIDHMIPEALGGPSEFWNERILPGETNLRNGGHQGAVIRDYRDLMQQGLPREDAWEVVFPEMEHMINSPWERPTDPFLLDMLEAMPLDNHLE